MCIETEIYRRPIRHRGSFVAKNWIAGEIRFQTASHRRNLDLGCVLLLVQVEDVWLAREMRSER